MLVGSRSVLSFRDVSTGFGGRFILENVSFDVAYGDFLYVVGKTGSGKSTLLKMIYADQKARSGELRVVDHDLNSIEPKDVPFLRRKLGIVFQDIQLLPERNVYNNIEFALRATGWKESGKIKRRISDVLVRVGMSGKAGSMPHQLSGGEQQRVAIGRALINDPVILIADEPTGNLDPEATDQVMEILLRINLGGTAVIMATHEHNLIRKYPAPVLEVAAGKLITYDKSEAFIEAKHWL